MSTLRPPKIGSIRSAVKMMPALDQTVAKSADRIEHKRRLVAELCRMLDPQPRAGRRGNGHANGNGNRSGEMAPAGPEPGENSHATEELSLSPRMRQTLDRLLAGDSEKEIAARFNRSRHTVHVYVKKLYLRYGVTSRGELFALFVSNRAEDRAPLVNARR